MKRVKSNLLEQDCYILQRIGTAKETSKHTHYADSVYPEIQELVTSSGIDIKIQDSPYPITPDYVQSFRDQADYHNDLVAASNISAERKKTMQNIGDIRSMQKMQDLDSEDIKAEVKKMSRFVEEYNKLASAVNEKKEDEKKEEVNDDGVQK